MYSCDETITTTARQCGEARCPDAYPTNRFGGRQTTAGRGNGSGHIRTPADEGDIEGRPFQDNANDDLTNSKLDRLLDRFDKFDVWRDEAERKIDNLGPTTTRETDIPFGFDEEDVDYGDPRRRRLGDRGPRYRNPTIGYRETPPEDRGRCDGRGRYGAGWEQPGTRQQFERPASCWDPPQRYQPQVPGYEKPRAVKMSPPRFDGTDATNWVSRVQYYFDHLMLPEAQRLHYAVMLFDPPASEWVFNYCANTDFVTWQDFLVDVRHRFDRQSFKNYFGLIAKLTQTGTVLEYHDTFEKYLNRVRGIPESELFTLFVAGPKHDMQERLRLHRPESLAEAMALALELADS